MNFFFFTPTIIFSLLTTMSAQSVSPVELPRVYIHVGVGAAFSFFSSSDIEGLIEEDFDIGRLGSPFSFSFHIGYSNLLQIEYRNGDSGHSLRNNDVNKQGEFYTKEEIEMDYDFEDWTLKFNPTFSNGKPSGFFLLAGIGSVKYFDDNRDGFEGTSFILGIEYFVLKEEGMILSLSIKRYGVSFDRSKAYNIPPENEVAASDYQIQGSISYGLNF